LGNQLGNELLKPQKRHGLKWGQGSINKKGRYWHIRYSFEGKTYYESTRTENEDEARLFLIARLRQHGAMSANAATLATDGLLSTIGCAAELLVAVDLLNRGIEVYRALSQHSSCDMIAHRLGRMVRVEVKTGRIGRYGPEVALTRQRGKFDVLAVVDRKSGIHYFPPIDDLLAATGPTPATNCVVL
jgi:hypothetical protein